MTGLRAVDHATIVVAVSDSAEAADAVALAAQLVSQKGELVFAHVIEVPLEFGLEAGAVPGGAARERAARELMARCTAVAERYGVSSRKVIERSHATGPAIVQLVERHRADLVVIAGDRRFAASGRVRLGPTATHVLRHAPCRVMTVSAGAAGAVPASKVA